ncbi:MAG TPA: efflux RND transporter periplasmic adaptor subunit [Burkholderiales bacterium]|nr:efflux RND transporter periplasmic adaptor subunit [Burkholderiales bacterium]
MFYSNPNPSASPIAAALVAAGLILLLPACSGQDSQAKPSKALGPAVPVTAAAVEKKTMPVRIRGIGNVEAYATVSVKARVDGQIVKVHFKEGQEVPKGAPLFEIDSRPFEAQLHQAEANLLRDKAQLENASAQERRYQDLLNKNFVSKEFYAQIRTNRDAAEATARADQAAVENARVQLEYTRIRSPINGHTGKIMIQEGNLVKANDTNSLVVINQISPIYVNFSVPEQTLSEIRRYQTQGTLNVAVTLPDTATPPIVGTLAFIDNSVDPATGTIKLKALFENQEKLLWPGQFAHVALTLYEQQGALVVPSQAVQTGPKGQYVFVVKPDFTTEMRDVAVAWADSGQTVIAKGLAAGEKVVTSGQLRLTPGAKVELKTTQAGS